MLLKVYFMETGEQIIDVIKNGFEKYGLKNDSIKRNLRGFKYTNISREVYLNHLLRL